VSFRIDSLLTQVPILPVLVFLAETCVVTLCTVRTICIARGRKCLAAFLGFFEVSIWLFAIGQIMQNLTDVGCYLAFAGGFSLGNFLGVTIEAKLALGNVVVQITAKKDANDLVESLKEAGYGVTVLAANGATGPVQVVFTVVKRKELEKVVFIIKGFDPKAFYSVKDLQLASEGISPRAENGTQRIGRNLLRLLVPALQLNAKRGSVSSLGFERVEEVSASASRHAVILSGRYRT
jgi:uncharacterized protein YebE (UPF0316 family)